MEYIGIRTIVKGNGEVITYGLTQLDKDISDTYSDLFSGKGSKARKERREARKTYAGRLAFAIRMATK